MTGRADAAILAGRFSTPISEISNFSSCPLRFGLSTTSFVLSEQFMRGSQAGSRADLAKARRMTDPMLSRHAQTETIPSGDRVVVYQTRTQASIVLNPTGSWLWNQLESPKTLEWLIESLGREHPEVDSATLRSDVEAYVTEMVENQVLVRQS